MDTTKTFVGLARSNDRSHARDNRLARALAHLQEASLLLMAELEDRHNDPELYGLHDGLGLTLDASSQIRATITELDDGGAA